MNIGNQLWRRAYQIRIRNLEYTFQIIFCDVTQLNNYIGYRL